VKLLLDTHALIWWLSASPRLGPVARAAISEPASEVHVSAVSACEIAIKKAVGKLTAPDDLGHQVAANGFTELRLSIEHGRAVGALPPHHGDLFDRMLIAQARVEGLTIVTADRIIADYDVPVLAADT
jgi:PIN domain nuclease of toxin-antitoxin system